MQVTFTPWDEAPSPQIHQLAQESTDDSQAKEMFGLMKDSLKLLSEKSYHTEFASLLPKLERFFRNPSLEKAGRATLLFNKLLTSKGEGDKIIGRMYEKKTEGEIARSGTNIYCLENNKVVLLSKDQVRKRIEKRKPVNILTNAELINLRLTDPKLIFNAKIFTDVSLAVNMEDLNKFCLDVISKMDELAHTKKGKISKKDVERELTTLNYKLENKSIRPEEIQGFNELITLLSSMNQGEGVYKYDIKNSSKKQVVDSTLKYLIAIMPKNMKDALDVHVSISGNGNPVEYLYNLINGGIKSTESVDVSLDDGEDGSMSKMNRFEHMFEGNFAKTIPLSIDKDSVVYLTGGTGPVFNQNLNAIGTNFLSTVLDDTNMGSFVDKSQIYFGSKKIDPIEAQNFIYKGTGQTIAEVPVDNRGNIDFKMFANLTEAEKQIKEAENPTPEVIKTIYHKHKVPTKEVNGRIEPNLAKDRYFIFNAVTTDKAIQFNKIDNPLFMYEPSSDREDMVNTFIENIYTAAGQSVPDGDPIEGTVFMRVSDSAQEDIYSLSGHGSLVPNRSFEQDMVRYNIQQSKRNNNFNAAGLDALK